MQNFLTLWLLFLLLPAIGWSQSRKKSNETTIKVFNSINYYPPLESYDFVSSYDLNQDVLLLTYLTANSGTFVIEPNRPVTVQRTNTQSFSSQLLGFGAGIQIINQNFTFHEISLTKLKFSKSAAQVSYLIGEDSFVLSGARQKSSAFGLRYEFGKYFGKKRSGLRFGLSGGIEPSVYVFKSEPASIGAYYITAKIFTLDVALIPMFLVNIDKKLSLEFKVIPNLLLADAERVRESNPLVPVSMQNSTHEYDLPEINIAFSISAKYVLKEPKKRRRKSEDE